MELYKEYNKPDISYYFTKGQIRKIQHALGRIRIARLVIFGTVLSPLQRSNLARKLKKYRIMDYFELILRLFGSRANRKETILELQLAALKYQFRFHSNFLLEQKFVLDQMGYGNADDLKLLEISFSRIGFHYAMKNLKKKILQGAGQSKKTQNRKTCFLKGHAVALRTGLNPCEYELSFIPGESDLTATDCPSLTKLQAMLGVVQQTLPKQFISSNRAENFNALHDRYNVYWGRKSLIHANRDVRAWAAVTFFPEGSRALLHRHEWHIPYRLLVHFLPLMISKVKMR